MERKNTVVWFLLGFGSQFQLVASLSMTELFSLVAAPLLIFREYSYMRRNGIMPLFSLSLCVIGGCVLSCLVNSTPFQSVLRGLATTCLVSCSIVVSHWVIRKDIGGFKWFLLGVAISFFLSAFVFQHSVEVSMLAEGQQGRSAVEAIMSGPLFWISRLNAIIGAIPKGWYLQCPGFICVLVPIGLALFAVLTSESGRSVTLGLIAASILVLIGGKTPSRIKRLVCRKMWMLAIIAIISIFALNRLYHYAAQNGMLTEKARAKYETQTRGSANIFKLLLAGRMESFCGLLACVDRPIVGLGPWAIDNAGYTTTFLSKYADEEDYREYIDVVNYYALRGASSLRLIPCHSYITQFWLWYGVFGLVFWIYVIFVLVRYLRQDCFAVPQLYMWLAASTPSFLWGIFFSPLSERFGPMLFVVACLMVRATRRGVCVLPAHMIREINKIQVRR